MSPSYVKGRYDCDKLYSDVDDNVTLILFYTCSESNEYKMNIFPPT